jgi:hypothetical protein
MRRTEVAEVVDHIILDKMATVAEAEREMAEMSRMGLFQEVTPYPILDQVAAAAEMVEAVEMVDQEYLFLAFPRLKQRYHHQFPCRLEPLSETLTII